MWQYLFKRLGFSILIVLGVIVVTFLLFRVASGDPAAAVLGKNPSPDDIERLRRELGADKPLFWGRWRRTEAFSSLAAKDLRALPGIELTALPLTPGETVPLADGARLRFSRNFPCDAPVRGEITAAGRIAVNGVNLNFSPGVQTIAVELLPTQNELVIAGRHGSLREVRFYLPQQSPWDSQLTASLAELVTVSPAFPYVTFFNFGRSLTTREPVARIILRGLTPSLLLMTPIFFGELLLGVILALISAAWKDSWLDRTIVITAVAGMSVSYLVFIIFGQWYLGYYYNFFPVWGYGSLRCLALPVLIGIVSGLGGGVRFYRTVFVHELGREYLRTARARGCGAMAIFGKHLLRNAAVPIITRAGTILPFLFTGSLLLETFFGIPGLGYAGINALNNSDLQMIKALVIIGALLFVIINLLTDIACALVDPRVRLK